MILWKFERNGWIRAGRGAACVLFAVLGYHSLCVRGVSLGEIERLVEKNLPKQLEQCKGCVWGKWDGLKQFCPKQLCVKV
ncbi:hypothetical protein GC093_18395 [Paenibacillus sp. LMG 31456]|uniref:Uncharacterized protein n=1 Tax=Paenibacillus foliorum TaxID=2654974 RepID=A0A972GWM8_9BACL|nr:hypothetical protein [Paenibacillus foliorum]